MITITIGRANDEITVRGKVSWTTDNEDDAILEAVDTFVRSLAAHHGWIVDTKTALYSYRERIAESA